MSNDRIRISKSDDGSVIWVWRNGSTWTFSPEGWIEFQALALEFNVTGRKAQNFIEEIPERVAPQPVATGKPKLASLNLADLGL